MDFNPRSHERSDGVQFQMVIATFISIHAPTRGATHMQRTAYRWEQFQSTLPREERQNSLSLRKQQGEISIHAPTRGATM